MKYIYVIVALILIAAGGYYIYSMSAEKNAMNEEVPEGYHRMPDGTLMRNDLGTEGMGSLYELQMQNQVQSQENN